MYRRILTPQKVRSLLFSLLVAGTLIALCLAPLAAAPPLTSAHITLQKFTDGEDAAIVPGPHIPVGSTIIWTYNVTNSGTVPLTDIMLTDDQEGLVCTKTTLAPGERMECTRSGVARSGPYTNRACVYGSAALQPGPGFSILISAPEKAMSGVEACDVNHYLGTEKVPAISVNKYVSVDGGLTWIDVDDPADPELPALAAGSPVRWKYEIANNGAFLLQNVTITDSPETDLTCIDGKGKPIDPEGKGKKLKLLKDKKFETGDTITCFANGTAVSTCPYVNEVTVTGEHGNIVVSDGDASYYCGYVPGSLRVCKSEVRSETEAVPYPGGWTMHLSGPPGYAAEQITRAEEGCTVFDSLVPGAYTLTEEPKDGWVNLTPSSVPVMVLPGELAQHTFYNTRESTLGSLEVCKYNLSAPYPDGWPVNVTGPFGYAVRQETNESGCTVFSHLVPGTYALIEDFRIGWVNLEPGMGLEMPVTVPTGTQVQARFVNAPADMVTDLVVCKYNQSAIYTDGWNISVDGPFKDNETRATSRRGCAVFYNLVIGEEYRVSEESVDGWTALNQTPVAIIGGVTPRIEFHNVPSELTTTLEVCKWNRTPDGDVAYPGGWGVRVTGEWYDQEAVTGEDGCTVVDHLVIGHTYTVTEESKPGWLNLSDNPVLILAGTDRSVSFTNVNAAAWANIRINKTVAPASASIGEEVTWTIVVTNHGPDPATNVTVVDDLTGLVGGTILSATPDPTHDATWNLGTLASGTSATITLVTTFGSPGEKVNTVTVSSDAYDVDTANNSDIALVTITESPPAGADLSLTKTASPANPQSGERVTYTITVTNHGPDPARNVTVTDDAYSSSWTVSSMAPGESRTFNLFGTYTCYGPQHEHYVNSASVASDSYDPTLSNNLAHVNLIVDCEWNPPEYYGDLQITKEHSAGTFYPGDRITWTVTVANNGPDSALNTTVQEFLDPDGTIIDANPTRGTFDPDTAIWSIGVLGNQNTAILTLNTTFASPGGKTNQVTVTSDTPEPDPTDNTATDMVEIETPSSDYAYVTGYVFNDTNADGAWNEATEPGLEGATVTLANASWSDSVITGAEGGFNVTVPAPGRYTLIEINLPAYISTNAIPGDGASRWDRDHLNLTIPALSREYSGHRFGDVRQESVAVISGGVFDDENEDGLWEVGERGLPGIDVVLEYGNGLVLPIQAHTNSTGTYQFAVAPGGAIRINSAGPDGDYYPTTPETLFLTPPASGEYPDNNFGYSNDTDVAVISGRVFNDLDGDGEQDLGESGLTGANVTLDGTTVITTSTNGLISGTFTFFATNPGIHSLHEDNPPGFRSTTPDTVNLYIGSLGRSYIVDFGDTNASSAAFILGTVFDDLDGDGAQDADEPGIRNVTVELSDGSTTRTGDFGTYFFWIDTPGWLTVTETDPECYHSTTPNRVPVQVAPEQSYEVNFGDRSDLLEGVSFFGTVFEDQNADSMWNTTEGGIPDVNVTLAREGEIPSASERTNRWGQYTFLIQEIGSFRVTEENLPEFVSTSAIAGHPDVYRVTDDQFGVDITSIGSGTCDPDQPLDYGENLFGDRRYLGPSATITACKGNISLLSTIEAYPGWPMRLEGPGGSDSIGFTEEGGCVNFTVYQPGTYVLAEADKEGWTRIVPTEENYTFEVSAEDIANETRIPGIFFNYNGTPPLGIIFGCKGNVSLSSSGMEPLAGWELYLDGPEGRETAVTGDFSDGLTLPAEWARGCTAFLVNTPGTYNLTEEAREGWTQVYPRENYTFVIEEGSMQYHQGVFLNYQGPLPLGIVAGCKVELSVGGIEPLPGWQMILEGNGTTETALTGDPFESGILPIPDEYLQGCTFFLIDTPGTYNLTEEAREGWTKIIPQKEAYSFEVREGEYFQGFQGTFANYNGTIPLAIIGGCKANMTPEGGYELLNGWEMILEGPDGTIRTALTGDPLGFTSPTLPEGPIEGCALFAVEEPGTYHLTEEERAGWTRVIPEEQGYTFTVTEGQLGQLYPGIFVNRNGTPPVPFAVVEACKYNDTGQPLSGWQMNLLGEDSSYRNQTTDQYGCAVFIVNQTGNYTLFESMQQGWQKESPATAGYELGIVFNTTYSVHFNNTLVEPPYATVTACKNDTAGNPLIGWQMNLLGEDRFYQNGMTDATGCTVFTVNESGNYTLFESMQKNWTRVSPLTPGYLVTVSEPGSYRYTFENEPVSDPYAGITACKNDTAGIPLIGWQMNLQGGDTFPQNGITDDTGCTVFTVNQSGAFQVSETPQPGWINQTPLVQFLPVITPGYYPVQFTNIPVESPAILRACKQDVSGGNLSGWRMILGTPGGTFLHNTTVEDGCAVFTVPESGTYTLSEDMQAGWQPRSPRTEPLVPIAVDGSAREYRYTFTNELLPPSEPYATITVCKENFDTGEPLTQWQMNITNGTASWSQATSDLSGCTVFSVNASGTWTVSERRKDGWYNKTPTETEVSVVLPTEGVVAYDPAPFVNSETDSRINVTIEKAFYIGEFSPPAADTPAEALHLPEGVNVGWLIDVNNTGEVPVTLSYRDIFDGSVNLTDRLCTYPQALEPGINDTFFFPCETLHPARCGLHYNGIEVTACNGTICIDQSDRAYYEAYPEGYSSIYGTVYDDRNGNGVQDLDEPGIGGVNVTLNGETTVQTDLLGWYDFRAETAGIYTVTEEDPSGYFSVTTNEVHVNVSSIGACHEVNFADAKQEPPSFFAAIAGTVYNDRNENRAYDADEEGIGGVAVRLLGEGNSLLDSALTDGYGTYSLSYNATEPITIIVNETDPAGLNSTTPNDVSFEIVNNNQYIVHFGDVRGFASATITACKQNGSGSNLSGWQMNLWREEDQYYRKNLTDAETGCTVFTVKTGTNYTLFESMQENWRKIEPVDATDTVHYAHYHVEVTEARDYRYTFVNEAVPEPNAYVTACKQDPSGAALIGWAMILTDDSQGVQIQSGMTDDTGCTVFTIHSTHDISASLQEVMNPGWVNRTDRQIDVGMGPTGRYEYTFINQKEGPAIRIEKSTNGYDADQAPGPSIRVGSTVNWSYTITNTGTVPLTDLIITDRPEGEIGSIPLLDAGQSVTRFREGQAKNGQYGNMGNVTGWYNGIQVTAEDASHYTGITPPGPTPPPGPPGSSGFSSSGNDCDYIETGSLELLSNGRLSRTVTICAKDGIGRLIAYQSSIAMMQSAPLESASIVALYGKTQSGENAQEFLPVGHAYDLLPYEGTFRGPALLKLVFSPEKWAALQGKNLMLGVYNPSTGMWEEIVTSINPDTRTITAGLDHLGVVGLFDWVPASPPEEPAVEPPTETVAEVPAFNIIPWLLAALALLLVLLIARWWQQREEGEIPPSPGPSPAGEYIRVPPPVAASESAFSTIIGVLNDIDVQLQNLERVVNGGATLSPPAAEAFVESFFITTQVAEEHMKNPDIRKHLTPDQIEQLNMQLQAAVRKMIALSRQSEPLLNAVQARFGEVAGT